MAPPKKHSTAIYCPESRTYQIPLTRGAFALVDLEDVEFLAQWSWTCSDNGYARRNPYIDGKRLNINMHRALAEHWGWDLENMEVDHMSRDRLDNRRCNLRVVTRAQNQRNKSLARTNKSGVKGVHWDEQRQKWIAQIGMGKKRRFLGRFDTLDEARAAYDKAALELYGEYAATNEALQN